MPYVEEVKVVKLNKNQQFLKDIDNLLRMQSNSAGEVARLHAARVDVASRMTAEEIAIYEATRAEVAFDAKKMAADIAEMEMNRDKNPI